MELLINQNDIIFIAGSFGMVGSAIKRNLLKNGYGIKKGEILNPSRKELDLTNYIQVEKWFNKNRPSIVIIAAAKVGGIYANSNQPFDFILENLKIQSNIIELAWKYKARRLLFLGSSCIYPKFCPQPILEDYLLTNLLEKTNEYYAIAKIAGIKLCQSLRIQHNFDAICLMPTNLYGPGDNYHQLNSHVIPSLIKKFEIGKTKNASSVTCWGSGNPLREFLYVEDLAEACTFALERWNPDSNNAPKDKNGNLLCWLNVGSKYEITIKALAQKISSHLDFKGVIKWDSTMPDGTPRKKLDTRRLDQLGWKAKTDLDEGLRLTIDAYKKKAVRN